MFVVFGNIYLPWILSGVNIGTMRCGITSESLTCCLHLARHFCLEFFTTEYGTLRGVFGFTPRDTNASTTIW